MRNLISAVFFLSILAQIFQPALASEISGTTGNSLLFSGEIKKGDAEKLVKTIIQNIFSHRIILDSPGGDIEEAIRVASIVKALHYDTQVAGGGFCASACFFIYLAGDDRLAAGTIEGTMPTIYLGYIGLHRPYFKSDPAVRDGSAKSITHQHDIMKITSDYLRNSDVPQNLIDKMMSRPSNDIYWMTDDDVKQIGEYSPGMEELLIARCNYSRHMIDDIASERMSKDSNKVADGLARMKAFADCESAAFPDLDKERMHYIVQLMGGWRPWLKQKVTRKNQQ